MKTTFLLSAALLSALPIAGTVQAQDMSEQQAAQPVSEPTSASPGTSTSAAPGSSGYGGVYGGTSASGGLARSGWATCGHMSKCNPDSGH